MEYWPATSHCAQFSTSCGCCNKLPQNEWLKRTEMSPPTVLEAKSQKSRYINRATLLSGNLWGGFFPCLFWVLEAASIALLEALSLQSLLLPSPTLLSSVSVSFPLLSLIKTLVIGLRTQQVNPGRSHLKIISALTLSYLQILFTNEVTVTDFRDWEIYISFGGYWCTHYTSYQDAVALMILLKASESLDGLWYFSDKKIPIIKCKAEQLKHSLLGFKTVPLTLIEFYCLQRQNNILSFSTYRLNIPWSQATRKSLLFLFTCFPPYGLRAEREAISLAVFLPGNSQFCWGLI